MKSQKQIAFIFFSLTAEAEYRYKRLTRFEEADKAIAHTLIHQTIQALESLGYPVFHFNESNQRGQSFGQRLANAYQDVFDLGYQSIIAVGNDAPDLLSLDMDAVVSHARLGKNVIGPTKRHGAYLIALSRDSFEYHSFTNLPWQQRRLLIALEEYCQGNLAMLPVLQDINSYRDLRQVITSAESVVTKLLLRIVLAIKTAKKHYIFQFESEIQASFKLLRAPPHL